MRIGYTAALYGIEYVAWSLRSVQDQIDEFHVLYTDRPSFGYETGLACPETESQLLSEVERFRRPGLPVHWHRGRWGSEGEHRNEIIKIARERQAAVILSVDTDELWDPETLGAQLSAAEAAPERDTLTPFVHFWRSFSHVCSDPSRPVRIIKPSGSGLRYADQKIPVLHFGYAQSEALTRYKIAIHGHRSEWRSEWLEGKFLSWKPGSMTKDAHPTCGWNSGFGDFFWNVRKTDAELVPVIERLLADHPYKNLEIIR